MIRRLLSFFSGVPVVIHMNIPSTQSGGVTSQVTYPDED